MKRLAVLSVLLMALSLTIGASCATLEERANADGSEEADTSGPGTTVGGPEGTPVATGPTTASPEPTTAGTADTGADGGAATPSGFVAYMYVEGIEGESTDKDHEGWIEILSYSYEVTGPAPVDSLHSGPPTMGEFSITKEVDSASPMLFLYACQGTVVPAVTLELCHSDGDRQTIIRYKLQDIIVTKVYDSASPKLATYGSGGAVEEILPVEEVPFTTELTEDVSLNYSQIQWEYALTVSGTERQKVSTGWNIEANNAI